VRSNSGAEATADASRPTNASGSPEASGLRAVHRRFRARDQSAFDDAVGRQRSVQRRRDGAGRGESVSLCHRPHAFWIVDGSGSNGLFDAEGFHMIIVKEIVEPLSVESVSGSFVARFGGGSGRNLVKS
jgi:hypothetical protein